MSQRSFLPAVSSMPLALEQVPSLVETADFHLCLSARADIEGPGLISARATASPHMNSLLEAKGKMPTSAVTMTP